MIAAAALFFLASCGNGGSGAFRNKLEAYAPQKGGDFDFSTAVINLSSLVDPETDREWLHQRIDSMASELSSRIGDEGDYEIIIAIINDYFYNLLGLKFDESFGSSAENPSSLYSLEQLLKTRKGICMNISLLYLMMGDKLGLPFYGVLIPGHIYVRCEPPGRSGINIETTYAGVEFYGYNDNAGLYFLDKSKTSYGDNLDKYEVLGAYLSNISIYFLNAQKYEEAGLLSKKASEMVPGAVEPLLSLSSVYAAQNNLSAAEEALLKAAEINPDSGPVRLMLGRVYTEQKRSYKAKENLEKALKLMPAAADVINEDLKKAGEI